MHSPESNFFVTAIGKAIFAIRWLLAPMYLLLYVALGIYIARYSLDIFEMFVAAFREGQKSEVLMLGILELVDMTMIANLVVMTTTGGYSIFVKEFPDDTPNRPRWLGKNFSSSEQKIKMVMSLIGIADVTLLHDFINTHVLWERLSIIGVFIVSGFAFCYFNMLMHHPSLHDSATGEDH